MRKVYFNLFPHGTVLLFVLIFGAIRLYGQSAQNVVAKNTTKINFMEGGYQLALKKAAMEHKYIFVDAYASWCGPCKQLKTETFTNEGIATMFNKSFINLSIDMERGEGIVLAGKWKVEEYPTLLILDMHGKILFRSIGFVDAQQLQTFGKLALGKVVSSTTARQ